WVEYQKRRRSGQSGTLAKAALDAAYPVRGRVSRGRRRRMNPTNVRALRRALRRVRGFKRMTRKVKGLGLWGRRGGKTRVVYRRARRGDLWDVEDAADEFDEAEDLGRSEEHTSELQSRFDLVCRLLLEKKKTTIETQLNDT